jgi:hypothetical protein
MSGPEFPTGTVLYRNTYSHALFAAEIQYFLEALYHLRSHMVRSADRLGIVDATEII